MSETVTATQAARNFADYLNRVAYRQESFVVVRGGRAVAELRAVPAARRLGDLPGLLSSLPHLSRDEADSFARDLDAARAAMNLAEVRDAWQS